MAALERVMQMRERGMSDPQIIQSLTQEGISYKDINEALSQSQIKYALNNQAPEMIENPEQQGEPENQLGQPSGEYVPSMEAPESAEQAQAYYPEYSAQAYPEYQASQSFDIETINEMIEQAVEEKNDVLKKQISSFTKFKEDAGIEIDRLSSRLQKIENTINEMQMAILKKIGDYGNDIHSIAHEMRATQDSFSKIINPLMDKRDLNKEGHFDNESADEKEPEKVHANAHSNHEKTHESPKHHENAGEHHAKKEKPREKVGRRSKEDFENYLR